MRTVIALAAALACSGAAQAEIVGEDHTYEVGGAEYRGYVARNTALDEPRGTVVIVHDWDGLTEYEKRRAEMLAARGYTAFAADVYGADNRPQNTEDSQRLSGELYADRDALRERLLGSLEAARGLADGGGGLVMMGYCFGGAAVLEAARAGAQTDGFVSFHGGLGTPEGQDYGQTAAPVLLLHGSADPVSGPAELARLVGELTEAGVEHEAQIYGGARHAFTVWGADDYDLEADQDSWLALQTFLDERL